MLLIFQAMDAAGKDGTIKHVMSGVNPQGCEVYSSSSPREELEHDFLWRYEKKSPSAAGSESSIAPITKKCSSSACIQELLPLQKLPPKFVGKHIWDERLADIAHFEDYLTRQGGGCSSSSS